MSGQIMDSAAPSYAIKIWADEQNIYAELPSINGPYVAAFARTEGGLSQALHILGAMHVEKSAEPYLRPGLLDKDMIRDGITQPDLTKARETLKKLGVI